MSTLTGSFLVARPVLNDPNFRQTVVLLLGHGDGGAYGVVVNRLVEEGGSYPVPVFEGGPCPSPGLVMLHGQPEWVEQSKDLEALPKADLEVAPGVYLGDASCLKRASDAEAGEPFRFRVFRGYSGWGPGQLEQEIAADAWAVVPASAELVFDVPPEDLWSQLRPRGLPEPSVN